MKDPEQLAKNAMKRGTFSFTDMLQNRTYPEDEVVVYTDERTVAELDRLLKRREEFERETNLEGEALADTLEAFEAERAEIQERLNESKYTIRLRGIPPERLEELHQKSLEEYPQETKTVTHPVTGSAVEIPIPNEERDEYYADLLWLEHIQEIEDKDGNLLADLDLSSVRTLRKKILPMTCTAHVHMAIQNLFIASDWYRGLTDEVF